MRSIGIGCTALLAMALPAVALAQTTATPPARPKVESQATLSREAKITLGAATATALKMVPGAKVRSHELERENGKLIYSFDMKTAGKPGIDEINVDAITGEPIGTVQHESDAPPKKSKSRKP